MERLRSRRININWPVKISHAKNGVADAAVINISTSGLLFRAVVRYRLGDLIELDIQLPDKSSVKVVGEVVREAHSVGYGLFFGVRFTSFAENGQRKLGDCLLSIRRAEMADEVWGHTAAPTGDPTKGGPMPARPTKGRIRTVRV
jgi:hypothetical protein